MERHRIEVTAEFLELATLLRETEFASPDITDDDHGMLHLVDGIGLMRQIAENQTRIDIYDHDEGVTVQRLLDTLRAHGFDAIHHRRE
jgi:hypothetical protein